MVIILMGVSGVGKTTVGELLARDLDGPSMKATTIIPPTMCSKWRTASL